MRALFISLCILATPLAAQEGSGFFDRLFGTDQAANDQDQGTLLENLIEDSLSDSGRVVTVTGFRGALSGQATLEKLTIADENGIWFTLSDATLDWNRAALFAGRLEVAEITAGSIDLPRLPEGDPAPTPEAPSFALPDLPVSIDIGQIAAETVFIGAPVFGIATDVSVEGAVSLANGDGNATLSIEKLDGTGALTLNAGYQSLTQNLRIDFQAVEEAGGIVATLANLPGAPAIDVTLNADAPLSDFTAELRLATDGAERLLGTVNLQEGEENQRISLDISGDIAPVFAPEYRPFFGDQIALRATAFTFPDGRLSLPEFSLNAREIALNGAIELDENRMPQRIDVSGRVAPASGETVLLPLSGAETRMDRADLTIQFDASQSQDWRANFQIENLFQEAWAVQSLALNGTGQIAPKAISADLAFESLGVDAGAALNEALGRDLTGSAALDWRGGPIRLDRLRLSGKNLSVVGTGSVSETGEIDAELALAASRLGNFSTLAGRALSGQAEIETQVRFDPLTRAFDANLSGITQDLSLSEPRLDALLRGTTTLDLKAARDETGVRLDLTRLENTAARITGAMNLMSGGSTLRLAGALNETSTVLPGLAGPSQIQIDGTEDSDRDWRVAAQLDMPALSARAAGSLRDLYDTPEFEGDITANASDLSVLSDLVGHPLAGALALQAKGSANADASRLRLDADLTGQNLRTGNAELNRLLAGALSAQISALRDGDEIRIDSFSAATDALSADAVGSIGRENAALDLRARLANLALLAPGFSGPLAVSGQVSQSDDQYGIRLNADGPADARASVSGQIAETLQSARLNMSGAVPLALANQFISPRSLSGSADFNLALNGPIALENLSGTITTNGARLATPSLQAALEDINGSIRMSGGDATLDLGGRLSSGGSISLSGPVALSAPYRAALAATAGNIRLIDPQLFETTANGSVQINGPLAGGARISGALTLEETNIQIPSSGLGGAGAIPEVTHLNEPPPVRGTRRRAGLLSSGTDSSAPSDGSGGYPLDLSIVAPSRIFVRGRGLDSEFGGTLNLTGTTENVVPIGQFDLIRGRLDILGRRLALQRAGITIQGDFLPVLDILATTQADDTTVNVAITGPAENPDIAFTSSPDLPQEEVLARLIFGRGLDTLSPIQAARLALAVRTLAGRGGEGVVGQIRNRAGLADLDVTTDADGNAAVRAGAYINDNIYSDITVDSAGETELNLNLDLSPSITVRGGVTNTGESSLGIFFERDY